MDFADHAGHVRGAQSVKLPEKKKCKNEHTTYITLHTYYYINTVEHTTYIKHGAATFNAS